MEELGQFTPLEGFRELLDKAEVGQAYMGRPCLQPTDPQCPPSAPNRRTQQVGWPRATARAVSVGRWGCTWEGRCVCGGACTCM